MRFHDYGCVLECVPKVIWCVLRGLVKDSQTHIQTDTQAHRGLKLMWPNKLIDHFPLHNGKKLLINYARLHTRRPWGLWNIKINRRSLTVLTACLKETFSTYRPETKRNTQISNVNSRKCCTPSIRASSNVFLRLCGSLVFLWHSYFQSNPEKSPRGC